GTLLWARTDREPCVALGYIPFRWSQEIAQSYYAETYYRELILSHIDNLNLFYVAATRAEQELHLFYGSGTHKEVKSIRHLIQDALVSQAENRVQLGTEQGRVVDQPWGRCYHFGEPVTPCRTPQDTPELLSEYPVSFNRNALKFRLSSQRYFEQEPSTPSLRSYGVMMHRVFEQIRYREEIAPQLARMRTEGELSASEAEELKRRIVRAMENPQIASWFDVRWSQVLNEHSILVPQDATQRRPDRVLTRGTEATVVDYKFGHRRVKAHGRQIASYMALLQRMGYREVHGYLWYVELEEVEEVCI
ncbi:MAG: Dna2/Cas4 domain-containing protein, partial [Alistipes sp.]|nr:Dna2/Cas4 domain-containing protein [Alistipes sp.]